MKSAAKPVAPRKRARAAAGRSSELEPAPNRRENILRAAERQFAEKGYHGVSIRNVADAAGVPLALVGYYYGPKVSLYQEIYRQRSGYIAERLQALEEARRAAPRGKLLEEIVRAFVWPALKLAATPDGRVFLRLVSRAVSDHLAEDEAIIRELFDPLALAFIEALGAALPHATRGQIAWCYQFGLGALLHHMTDQRVEHLSLGENRADDEDTAAPLLVRFITAGVRGVCGAGTRA